MAGKGALHVPNKNPFASQTRHTGCLLEHRALFTSPRYLPRACSCEPDTSPFLPYIHPVRPIAKRTFGPAASFAHIPPSFRLGRALLHMPVLCPYCVELQPSGRNISSPNLHQCRFETITPTVHTSSTPLRLPPPPRPPKPTGTSSVCANSPDIAPRLPLPRHCCAPSTRF